MPSIEGLIIGALQAATGGIAGFVAGRITKAVGDAVAARVAENTSKSLIQAMSTSIVDAAKDGIKGTIRQIVQPKLLKLIQGGTDHADAFFEAQEDAAIDAGKAGEETVFNKQKDIAATATTDKKAPLTAVDALFQAASGAYDQAVEVQKDITLKAWYSYKAQLAFGTTAKGGTDINKVNTGMYESTEGEKPTGFLAIRVVKKPGWNDLSISLFEDTTCWLAAKGGDKIITESHLLGDKHYPSGGDAAVMKGIDVLMAEVANESIKGYIVPDRG
jgi:hypothetical protein